MPRSFSLDRAANNGPVHDRCGCGVADHPGDALETQLVNLDRRKVAVRFSVQGRDELVVGVGSYGIDPDLGGVLRVQTSREDDAPELMFIEDLWNGNIRRGHSHGCDFLIHLG